MKINKILFALFAIFQIMTTTTNAQTFSLMANGDSLTNDTIANLTSFSAKYNSGKIYLKWTVTNQHTDGLYLVYRSTDGINYENIGSKHGIGVPISKEIAYYFVDSNDLIPGKKIYRLVHVSAAKSFLTSKIIDLTIENEELVVKKN